MGNMRCRMSADARNRQELMAQVDQRQRELRAEQPSMQGRLAQKDESTDPGVGRQ